MRSRSSELTSPEPRSLGVIIAAFKSWSVEGGDLGHLFSRELEIE
jgi:hypothetical protein